MSWTTDAGLGLLLGGLLAVGPLAAQTEPAAIVVTAAETVGTTGDADDPAIWVSPADPARSLILGTDKAAGLYIYRLDGAVRQFLPDGRLNNVDLRPFTLGGQEVALAGASRRDNDTLVFYTVEEGSDGPAVRPAVPWQHAAIPPGVEGVDDVYGFAMGQDRGGTYAIVNFKSGHVVQWRVLEARGALRLELARVLQVGSQPEGMVADDAAGHLYIGEEDAGIWRVPLSPESAEAPVMVAPIPSPCLPRSDVEGLAIHDGSGDDAGGRVLVASAQGINRAALLRLDGEAMPACQALVEVAPGTGEGALDGVTETDGLDVTPQALPGFPTGLLVMMDDQNAGFTTNFKLIGWDRIEAVLPAR